MYEEYFGLERPPFKITPDTSLFFEGGKRGDILGALAYAIHRGEGIIKVVGEVGSGKTMLCRMLQLKLPDTVEIVYIANPSVSAEDILFVIAHELSLSVEKDASKHQVIRMLQDYLLQRHMENKQVVLFVEEAQGMPLDTLEEIRLLSNLETDENKLLQIILFGQPELDQNLAIKSIRQLRERITHNFELEPLTQQEIHKYLNFRMRQVGYTGPELISDSVAKKVEQHSEGLLRRINIIADKILLSAFAEGTHNLGSKHVTAAVNDSAFSQEVGRKSSSLIWWIMLLVFAALAVGLYQTRTQWMAFASLDMLQQPSSAVAQDPVVSAESVATPSSDSTVESAVEIDRGITERVTQAEQPELSVQHTNLDDDGSGMGNVQDETQMQLSPLEMEALAPMPAIESAETNPEMTAASTSSATLSEEVDELVAQIEVAVQQSQLPSQGETAVEMEDSATQQGSSQQRSLNTSPAEARVNDPRLPPDYADWLNDKLEESQNWLSGVERDKMSIQVMMRKKSAARELVYYLLNEWPLDLSQTYLYEVIIEDRTIYRVFYSEYDTLKQARAQIDVLPESIKVNSPYVHSIYRMHKALL
jgi:MSHA biogenesis protein MshM